METFIFLMYNQKIPGRTISAMQDLIIRKLYSRNNPYL